MVRRLLWREAMAAELRSERPPVNAAPVAEIGLDEIARSAEGLPLRDFLAIAEAWRIARALRDHRGNRSAAARALGIGRRTLYTKMEKLGLVPTWTLGGTAPNGGL
jgi:DNA-binding NtrC family response regulator